MQNYLLQRDRMRWVLMLILFTLSTQSQAQLYPLESMFYQNRYLLNPALAGINRGLNVNATHQQQWTAIPGSPVVNSLTGDYAISKNVGTGLILNTDATGIFNTIKIAGSYAYHMQLDETAERYIHFGLSLTLNNSRVDYNKVIGNASDLELKAYDQTKPTIDSDLGIAYTDDKIMVSAALPNLNTAIVRIFDKQFDASKLSFISATSYKFELDDEKNTTLEALAGYRVVKGYKDIVDLGANFTMVNYKTNLQVMYHSSKYMSTAVGVNVKPVTMFFCYNFEFGTLRTYTGNTFEAGVKIHLFDNQ